MRKVFLGDLPRKGNSKNISWCDCIGREIRFIYDNIEGYVKIIDYIKGNMPHIQLEYNGINCEPISICSFQRCQLGVKVLKVKNYDFMFKIDEVIDTKNGKIKITDIKKDDGKKIYKYKCLECGFDCNEHYINGELIKERWITEGSLKNGSGCLVCGNNCTVTEINSIYKLYPRYKDLGIDSEWAKKYSLSTHTEAPIICPNCGNKYSRRADHVIKNSNTYCNICGDGFKFPEKFMSNILNQLNIDYITQLSKTTFKWCENKRYDFYIPSLNMIIETHGSQHYEETNGFSSTLQEIQVNDIYKEKLARDNGIEHYISIDFRKSKSDWGMWNVYKNLKDYFDFSNVNFETALIFAGGNYKKQICEMWSSFDNDKTISDFIEEFNLKETRTCIRNYLKFGDERDWCIYNAEVENLKANKKSSEKAKERDSKSINVIKDGHYITTYKSFADLEKYSEIELGVKISKSGALQRCKKRINKPLHGYMFEYADNN